VIKAVIFDLDGVLVSTDELHFQAWKTLADELGITTFTREDNLRQRGVSRMASLEVVLEKSGRVYSDEEKLALADKKNTVYVESIARLTPSDVLPGARETLALLRDRGILTAIGSASRNTPLILEAIGIADTFDAIADGRDVTESKPSPAVFLCAARKLGVPPNECAVVEDADAGIEAAVRGGFVPVAVSAARYNPNAKYSAQSLADGALDWDVILG
jgi:beta-phosphoglucomutase